MDNKTAAFALTRLTVGVNFFMHGFIRMPKLGKFADGVVEQFQDTMIGFEPLLRGYAYGLSFAELLLGLALIVGFKTKYALAGCSLVMTSLIFGSCVLENWSNVGTQMIYVAVVYLLLANYVPNTYSVDGWLRKT
jgi:thiosulfate dehydrogenase [quinone] large subunit